MSEVIRSIRRVSIELSKWVGYATASIDKIELDDVNMPQDYHSCAFGKWYQKDQWNLSEYEEYSLIEKHHIQMHDLFDEMMGVVNKKQKPSFFKKMTGAKPQMSKSDKKILLAKFQEFKKESQTVLALLKNLQNEVAQTNRIAA